MLCASDRRDSAIRYIRENYAIRDVETFKLALSCVTTIPREDLNELCAFISRKNLETHECLEFLSELSFRAALYTLMLQRGAVGEEERDFLVTIGSDSRQKLRKGLEDLGIPRVFWEDVVFATIRRYCD